MSGETEIWAGAWGASNGEPVSGENHRIRAEDGRTDFALGGRVDPLALLHFIANESGCDGIRPVVVLEDDERR
jgi:hypothetical protein